MASSSGKIDKQPVADSSDSDSNDDWEEIHGSSAYDQNGIVGRKFETYAGGPAGGYIYCIDDGVLYSWNQEWFEPVVLTKLPGKKLEFRIDPRPGGRSIEFLKVVDTTPNEHSVSDTEEEEAEEQEAKKQDEAEDEPPEVCSDYDSEASSVGDLLHPKKLTDEQIINHIMNPDAGMEGFIGGKRGRPSVPTDDMAVREDDPDVVKRCFKLEKKSIKQWFKELDTPQQLEFMKIAKTYKQNPDRMMNHAVPMLPEVMALEAELENIKRRFNAAEAHTVNIMLEALKSDLYDKQKEQYNMVSLMTFCETVVGMKMSEDDLSKAMQGLSI